MLNLITGNRMDLKVRARNMWCDDTLGKVLVELRWLDPITWALQYNSVVPDYGWYDLTTLVGLPYAIKRNTEYVYGFRPNTTSYVPSRDDALYSNFWSNIAAFDRVMRGMEVDIFHPDGEHNVHHPNVSGTLYPAFPAEWATRRENNLGAAPKIYTSPYWITPTLGSPIMAGLPSTTSGWYGDKVKYLGPNTVSVAKATDAAGKGRVDLSDFVQYSLVEEAVTGVEFTRAGTGIRTSKHTYEDVWAEGVGTTSVSFGYTLAVRYPDNGAYAKYRITHSFFPTIPGATLVANPIVGTEYSLYLGASAHSNASTVTLIAKSGNPSCVTPGVGVLPTTVGAMKTGKFGIGLTFYSSPEETELSVPDVSVSQREAYGAMMSFTSAVNMRMGDIRMASYNATSDALSDLTDSLSVNMIENLVELKEIAGLVPDLSTLSQAMRQLSRKKWLSGGKTLVDFVTGLRLQTQFGTEPTIDLLVDILPRIPGLLFNLSQSLHRDEVVARGSYAFDFPSGEFNREESHLKASSKVVLSGDFSPLVKRILGLKAFGMLPSPSSMWDLLPLSFVVDWFANIGGRLTDVENISIATLLNVRVIVYSYLVTSPLQEGDLSIVGDADGAGLLRVYDRDISRYLPRVQRGRYDFAMPDRLPDWETAGSLAWQLFVS